MGALMDLGYRINRNEQDPFGIEDLAGSCGNFCPEAGRRLGFQTNSTVLPHGSGLSVEAEEAILHAAASRFRNRSTEKTYPAHNTIAVLYEEKGDFHSRIVSREQVIDFI